MVKIGLLYGGNSGEHQVSLCSASSVFFALDKSRYDVLPIGIDHDGRWFPQTDPQFSEDKDFGKIFSIEKTGNWLVNHFPLSDKLELTNLDNMEKLSVDLVLPVVHGSFCEDGTLQGLLELAGVPYVGAGVLGSSLAMDKDLAKIVLKEKGIPVVPWLTIHKQDWSLERSSLIERIIDEIGFPFFVKPANAGSSVGIHKIKERAEIEEKISDSLRFDHKVLIEKSISCREIECAVLGNESPEVSIAGEIIPNAEFYSYDAKYIDDNGAVLNIPADLSEDQSKEIRDIALDAYKALNLSGLSRVDFFFEDETQKYYLNEINTLPGFTSISMYPKLWEHSGLAYSKLLDKLIDLAMSRFKSKKEIVTSY